jgi:hypothetical protein
VAGGLLWPAAQAQDAVVAEPTEVPPAAVWGQVWPLEPMESDSPDPPVSEPLPGQAASSGRWALWKTSSADRFWLGTDPTVPTTAELDQPEWARVSWNQALRQVQHERKDFSLRGPNGRVDSMARVGLWLAGLVVVLVTSLLVVLATLAS